MDNIEYINQIIGSSKKYDYIDSDTEMYAYHRDIGDFKIILFKDSGGKYLDLLKYCHRPYHSFVEPISYTLTTPKDFCNDFLTAKPFSFEILSITAVSGKKVNIQKPKELKGIKQCGSAKLLKCKNPVFILGDDLYLQCNDYFSPTLFTKEEVGTPLSYRAKKYCSKGIPEKFIYADNFGEIVLRRKAWLKFSNFLYILKHLNKPAVADLCLNKIAECQGFCKNDIGAEYRNMLEDVCEIAGEYA